MSNNRLIVLTRHPPPQVSSVMALANGLVQIGRDAGRLAASTCIIIMMCKHMLVDSVVPPAPAIITFSLSTAAVAYGYFKQSKIGLYAFMATFALNAAVFIMSPATPIGDTFPWLGEKSSGYPVVHMLHVVSTHQLQFWFFAYL